MKTIEVVAALIIQNGRFFAAQRGIHQSHAGCWEFPGGKVEPHESHQEALQRELFEELKIRAFVHEYIETKETIDKDLTIRVHLYRTLIDQDNFTKTEHQNIAWLTINEAQKICWTQADSAFIDDMPKIFAAQQSIYEALPNDFDALHTRAKGAHIFRAIQKPWDARKNIHHAIGRRCKQMLQTRFDTTPLAIDKIIRANDGTTRIIFLLKDGLKIETIHMPRDVKNPRVTLCISSQVGCAMNCAFCATATLGLKRNLTTSEIVQQVIMSIDHFGPQQTQSVNIVFMGMGEALMNIDNVLKAIDILAHPCGLNIAPTRMTLSTSGVLSALEKLKRTRNRPNLAISVNATTDQIRNQLMPVNHKFNLSAIHEALKNWPARPHEKILLEYVLLKNVNDTKEDALRLAQFAKDIPHNINIIPYNETPNNSFHAPDSRTIEQFIQTLQNEHCFVTLRVARGAQVGGACGQLIAKLQENTKL